MTKEKRPIDAVIFDWGGTLIKDPSEDVHRYCAAYLGVSNERFTEMLAPHYAGFHRGVIKSEQELWGIVCPSLGVPPPRTALWKEAFQHSYQPYPYMFSSAFILKTKRVRTAVLSNTEAPAVEFFREQKYTMFNETIFSCVEGYVKPEPEIWHIALRRLKSAPEQTLYLDDRMDYVLAAKNLGMQALLCVYSASFIATFSQIIQANW